MECETELIFNVFNVQCDVLTELTKNFSRKLPVLTVSFIL